MCFLFHVQQIMLDLGEMIRAECIQVRHRIIIWVIYIDVFPLEFSLEGFGNVIYVWHYN